LALICGGSFGSVAASHSVWLVSLRIWLQEKISQNNNNMCMCVISGGNFGSVAASDSVWLASLRIWFEKSESQNSALESA